MTDKVKDRRMSFTIDVVMSAVMVVLAIIELTVWHNDWPWLYWAGAAFWAGMAFVDYCQWKAAEEDAATHGAPAPPEWIYNGRHWERTTNLPDMGDPVSLEKKDEEDE